jgi:hypothetical protein
LFLSQTGGDGMLGRGSALFTFPNRLDFLAYELADVSGRYSTFAFFFARLFLWFFLWHTRDVSPLNGPLDVVKATILRSIKLAGDRSIPPLALTALNSNY